MDWIDSHCHLDAAEFDADRDQVRASARAAGVGRCVLPAVEVANFDTVRLLAHQHADVYALGIHPLYTPQAREEDVQTLDQQLHLHRHDPRLVAVGEIGLDGWLPGLDMARQQWFYTAQLQLAQQHGLPVILHGRRSADLLLKGLRQTPVKGGIAHAFVAATGHHYINTGEQWCQSLVAIQHIKLVDTQRHRGFGRKRCNLGSRQGAQLGHVENLSLSPTEGPRLACRECRYLGG
jgi:Tat protein secretion system quality control protein TatD with DNase activity